MLTHLTTFNLGYSCRTYKLNPPNAHNEHHETQGHAAINMPDQHPAELDLTVQAPQLYLQNRPRPASQPAQGLNH